MKTLQADLWEMHSAGHWVCIPTNKIVLREGLVMGKGVALEASKRFPGLRSNWGDLVTAEGNIPFPYPPGRLLSFPTKTHWQGAASLKLIEESAHKLKIWWPCVEDWYKVQNQPVLPVCLPKVGCGCGGLDWEQVFPMLSSILNDNYIAVI